ncbi:hypothetical protein QCA50_004344 [Cerrena zonata]|uniref:Translation initiation factor eIF2B subunit gamma n=1 Tax=Cerrena zonata TaxID=2478898 RepID=A0AAW0GJ64_9APHY
MVPTLTLTMDFEETSSNIATKEFQAVLLAGFGNELVPLTSNHGEEPCPKALLPIANKPMLDYPLAWLEASGIRDVLVICPAPHRASISHYINSDSSASSFPSLRIDLQAYDESENDTAGTCQILRHFANRIEQDFLLLPCDFIPPPTLTLSSVLNKFRTESTYDGAIATTLFFEQSKPDKANSLEEWGSGPSTTSVVWDEKTRTLLHIDTLDQVDDDPEEMVLDMNLLRRYPRAKLSANLQDAHVYLFRKSVLDVLKEKTRFDSIREDFIPWLCTPQYHPRKRNKYGRILNPLNNVPSQTTALEHSTLHSDILSAYDIPEETRPESAISSPVDDFGHTETSSLRVGVVVHRAASGYTARANTLHTYIELNRHFLSHTTYSLPKDPESRALIDPKAQISTDSMVGHTTKVGERTTIKKSVIGKHCVIGKYVKITGCVILDHCVIADGAKLEGCILGTSTTIGSKAELSKCVTQGGYEVGDGENSKNERLEVSDWTAAQNDDSSEEDSDEE